MMIRRLDPILINQIAAGEVIERPAAVVKELLDNAIDAGATEIDITLVDGGKTLTQVRDNGSGIPASELPLAVERHATSKLPDNDLFRIASLGFRGEALPSIGAVSHLEIISKVADDDAGWRITVRGGEIESPHPHPFSKGTQVTVKDLFFATPARLKFLKTPATELSHALDHIKRQAMIYPEIKISCKDHQRSILDYSNGSRAERLQQTLNKEWWENSLDLQGNREGCVLEGRISLTTYHRSNAQDIFFIVNKRPIRDKILLNAIRTAYQDFMASDRFPMGVIYLTVPFEEIDVNVHPAKAEVRFREPQLVRNLIINTIKQELSKSTTHSNTFISSQMLNSFQNQSAAYQHRREGCNYAQHSFRLREPHSSGYTHQQSGCTAQPQVVPADAVCEPKEDYPLGISKAQVRSTYIIAEAEDGLVIIDQHAAHERIVYETLKHNNTLPAQSLLIPEVIELDPALFTVLQEHIHLLRKLGFGVEFYAPQTLIIRSYPALLGAGIYKPLIESLAQDILEFGQSQIIEEHLSERLSTYACHHSVRSGKTMSSIEMNALLRQIEETAFSNQCNHGRPTWVKLSWSDVERLFGRT